MVKGHDKSIAGGFMRVTVDLDDDLARMAQALTGIGRLVRYGPRQLLRYKLDFARVIRWLSVNDIRLELALHDRAECRVPCFC